MSEAIKKEQGHFRRNWLFYTLLGLALAFSAYLLISKTVALKKQAEAFDTERTLILDQAQEAFKTNTEKHLELMMRTFVWAVRSEMTRGNQEQVNLYFKQLVKADRVEEVTLVDKSGTILITTNKKNEGSKLAADYADAIMQAEEVTVIDRQSRQVVAAPVLSLDSHIGTLMFIYKKDTFQLEEKVDLTKPE